MTNTTLGTTKGSGRGRMLNPSMEDRPSGGAAMDIGDPGQAPAVKGGVVKSARRVLEVFEYFDRVRRSASLMEISRDLEYPQSSTTELLKSLEHLGYLGYDPHTRQYMLTHRVSLLGSWMQNHHMPHDTILAMMEDLGEQCHETIILAEQAGTVVRYIYVVPSRKAMRLHVGPGTVRPVARSGVGLMFLANETPERVRQLLKRINAERAASEPIIGQAEFTDTLAAIRADGFHVFTKGVNEGAGTVSMMLPHTEGFPPLALAIGGLADSIAKNRESLITMMRTATARYLA